MTGGITFELKRHTPALDALYQTARKPRGFMAAVGKRGERELRAHFARREAEPNKKGWPKRHFWNRRIRSNTALAEVTANLALIAIAAPEFAQKLHGGTIRPREAKYLAIPARKEAYGKSPRSFGNLRFIHTGKVAMLVPNDLLQGPLQPGVKRVRGDGKPYYFLVRSVTQKADPRALPPRADFEAALLDEAGDYLAREARRQS